MKVLQKGLAAGEPGEVRIVPEECGHKSSNLRRN
jgi:hypothetical protein